jgi:glycosyltransferase involved in cell wall biosynthesis
VVISSHARTNLCRRSPSSEPPARRGVLRDQRSAKTRARYASLVPGNVTFTGYLSEPSYQSLLASCDVILALTTAANTLLCGAYEAVALAKPLVMSEQKVMTDYFYKGCVTACNTPRELAAAVERALANAPRLTAESRELAKELEESWQRRFGSLLEVIANLKASGPRKAIPA